MSSAAAKLAGFAAALAVLFGVGALAGGLLDASAPGGEAAASDAPAHETSKDDAMSTMTENGSEAGGHGAPMPVRGLAVAENGLRVVVDDPELARDETERLRFRIVGADGETVRDFDVEHTKRMHLIVARRDLTGFQHLHPTMEADGTWTTNLRLRDAGSYRMFADFSHDEEPTTLAADLRVDGDADLHALPAPAATATSDGGYQVALDGGTPKAGVESELRFTVTKDGERVETEPYLGAGGHLVALREGDLAFLHVHPMEDAHGGEAAGDAGSIGFESTFPTTGAYRLFLQFKVGGKIQTVAFTQEVR
jgi:hypothetical protein